MSVLVTYRKVLLRLLKQGYDSYSHKLELHQSLLTKNNVAVASVSTEKDHKKSDPIPEKTIMTVQEGFDFRIKLKEKIVNQTSKRGYENKLKIFLEWLSVNHPEIKFISELKKKLIVEFLNDVLNRNSARTRNNYKTDLSSIIQVLVENEIIEQNFIRKYLN